jgi:hypothetical protein
LSLKYSRPARRSLLQRRGPFVCARPGPNRIGTAMGIAPQATIIVIAARRLESNNPYKQKGEPLGLPLLILLCRLGSDANYACVSRATRTARAV